MNRDLRKLRRFSENDLGKMKELGSISDEESIEFAMDQSYTVRVGSGIFE